MFFRLNLIQIALESMIRWGGRIGTERVRSGDKVAQVVDFKVTALVLVKSIV